MRKGLVCSVALLLGAGWGQAQYWPAQGGHPASRGPTYQTPPFYRPPAQAPVAPPSMVYPAPVYPAVYQPPPERGPVATPSAPAVAPHLTPLPAPSAAPAPAVPVAPPAETVQPARHGAYLPSGAPWIVDDPDPSYPRPEKPRCDPSCREHFWFSADYLGAWFRRGPLSVPLVTAGSPEDASPGALGQPGTSVLFGGRGLEYGQLHGVRAEVGIWLDQENYFSLDVGGFYLFPTEIQYRAQSDPNGSPLLTRPVVNAITGTEQAFFVAFPDTASGGIVVDSRSELFGAEINGRCHALWGRRVHSEALIGFRYLRLEERLRIQDRLVPLSDDVLTFLGDPVGTSDSLSDTDQFGAVNQFYGIQLGGRLRWEHERFYVDIFSKTGLGVSDQQVRISGTTSLTTPGGGVQSAPGGILALPTNSGEHNRHVFSVVPEVGVSFGVDVHRNLRVKAGYSFLLWTNVIRPGSHVDRVVNPALVPSDPLFGEGSGPGRPTFSFDSQVFWAHVFNVGLEFHY